MKKAILISYVLLPLVLIVGGIALLACGSDVGYISLTVGLLFLMSFGNSDDEKSDPMEDDKKTVV